MNTDARDLSPVLDTAVFDVYRRDRETAFRSIARLMVFDADSVVEAALTRLRRHREINRDEIERRWIQVQAHASDRVPDLDIVNAVMASIGSGDRQELAALAGEGPGHLVALIVYCLGVLEFDHEDAVSTSVNDGNDDTWAGIPSAGR